MTCQSWHLRARFRPYVWENREKRDKKIQLCATLRTAEWCKWSCFCFFQKILWMSWRVQSRILKFWSFWNFTTAFWSNFGHFQDFRSKFKIFMSIKSKKSQKSKIWLCTRQSITYILHQNHSLAYFYIDCWEKLPTNFWKLIFLGHFPILKAENVRMGPNFDTSYLLNRYELREK